MKTAEFNLELALAGHPLVTRGAKKIVGFTYNKDWVDNSQIIVTTEFGGVVGLPADGKSRAFINDTKDILLDLSVPWERPIEEGDEVLVKNYGDSEWINNSNEGRIYLCQLKNGKYLCVRSLYEREYRNDMVFETDAWGEVKKLAEDSSIEITVKINGKEAKLSDISDETLAKLKEV